MKKWIDVSQPFYEGMTYASFFPKPEIRRVMELGPGTPNITRFNIVVHQGTHVDAPIHILPHEQSIDKMDLNLFHGEGVVWSVSKLPGEMIAVKDIMGQSPRMKRGDFLLLNTGWGRKYGTPEYNDHPHFSMELADWLCDLGVVFIGMDMITPEVAYRYRSKDFSFEIHRRFFESGVVIAENLAPMDEIVGRRVEILALPLRIVGADGSPSRIVVKPI
jgi:kynurenine formamidase